MRVERIVKSSDAQRQRRADLAGSSGRDGVRLIIGRLYRATAGRCHQYQAHPHAYANCGRPKQRKDHRSNGCGQYGAAIRCRHYLDQSQRRLGRRTRVRATDAFRRMSIACRYFIDDERIGVMWSDETGGLGPRPLAIPQNVWGFGLGQHTLQIRPSKDLKCGGSLRRSYLW